MSEEESTTTAVEAFQEEDVQETAGQAQEKSQPVRSRRSRVRRQRRRQARTILVAVILPL
jgi:hypothetical protein